MPHLKALAEAHADDLVIIGVHSTKGSREMKDFVIENEIQYPVAADLRGKTMKAYRGNSYPDYFLIDRKGLLRFADLANAELPRAVEFLLAEPSPEQVEAPE